MVRKIWLSLLAVGLFASAAWGDYIPAPAFTAVGPNGRPMTGATITVTDSAGADVDVYGSSTGSSFSGTVPSTGIVQFYGNAGTYIVTVSGTGTTRRYWVAIPTDPTGLGVTSINGDTTTAITLANGTSGTTPAFSAPGSGTITLNIPEAGSGITRGLVTNSAQAFSGAKTFNSGAAVVGATVLNYTSTATGDTTINSDNDTAIFVDASTDSVGFFDTTPYDEGFSVKIKPHGGSGGLYVEGGGGNTAIAADVSGGFGYAIAASASGASDIALRGNASSTDSGALDAYRGSGTGTDTLPVAYIHRNLPTDETPLLLITESQSNTAVAMVEGKLASTTKWYINQDGQYFGTEGGGTVPTFASAADHNTGFGFNSGIPCIIDEGVCVVSANSTSASVTGTLFVDPQVRAPKSDTVPAFSTTSDATTGFGVASATGNPFMMKGGTIEFYIGTGVAAVTGNLSVLGVSAGNGHAVCVKDGSGTLGYCTNQPNGSGVCTCA